MRKSAQIILVSLMCLGLTACPNLVKPKKSKSGAVLKRVKGDPNIFIKDTSMNGLRALPASISAAQNWEFDISGFQEEEAIADVKEFVKKQTPKETAAPEVHALQSRMVGDQWIIEGQYKGTLTHFLFNRSANGWVLYSFKVAGRGGVVGQSKAAVVHTSVLPDQSAFSLLIQETTPGKKMVASLMFVRQKSLVKRAGDKLFEYLFGKGVKVAWNKQKPRTLLFCGALPAPLPAWIQEEAQRWAVALEGKLNFQTAPKANCPPFSDLNTQTFAFTTDWIEIVGDHGVEAQTLSIAGEGRAELIDGDIFYLLGEHQESLQKAGVRVSVFSPLYLNQPSFQRSVRRTTLHEIGHLLGLHHQFDPGIPSIMSYDEKTAVKLHDYDVKAIQALYAD